jgi:protein TonB
MRVRISFLVMMLAIGCSVALARNNATSNGGGQVPDAANNATPGSKDNPARVSTGVMMRLLLHKVDPIYPEDARKDHVSGAVVVAAIVDDQGQIVKASVVSGPEKLRDTALNAVNQWTFKPYLLNGRPAFVQTQFVVNFNIAN